MSNNNEIAVVNNNILKVPGDKVEAYVTPTGNQVVKVNTEDEKFTAIKYPTTGTVVKIESSKGR